MDIETTQDTPKPERETYRLDIAELKKEIPQTVKLANSTLQKLRLTESMDKIKEKAISEFISSQGFKGSLNTSFQGLQFSIRAGGNPSFSPTPEGKAEYAAIFGKSKAIMDQAIAAGAVKKSEKFDFNIVIGRPEKAKGVKNNAAIEKLIGSTTPNHTEMPFSGFAKANPTLKTYLFCKVQEKALSGKLEDMRKEALKELELFPDSNFESEINFQELRISTYNTPSTTIDESHPDAATWKEKLTEANKGVNKELEKLEREGKVKKDITYYLTITAKKADKELKSV